MKVRSLETSPVPSPANRHARHPRMTSAQPPILAGILPTATLLIAPRPTTHHLICFLSQPVPRRRRGTRRQDTVDTVDTVVYHTSAPRSHMPAYPATNEDGEHGWCESRGRHGGMTLRLKEGEWLMEGRLWAKVIGEAEGGCRGWKFWPV